MYNRYIPTADGGYRCQPVRPQQAPPPPAEPRPDQAPPCRPEPHTRPGGLLRRLLPQGLEADDLLILLILLLLVLDGEGEDDTLTALLAVAAFLMLR